MTERDESVSRARQLRQAFDQSFAAPPPAAAEAQRELLAIKMGTARYAMPLPDIRGLFAGRKIAPLPAQGDELLGMASFRGAIVPVYGLHTLLGAAASGQPRWLAIAATASLALAFESLEGLLRVPPDAIAPYDAAEGEHRHMRGYLRVDGTVRGVVDVPSLAASIAKREARRD